MSNHITEQQARELIAATNGLIFQCFFRKRTNGEWRIMSCRTGVKKYLKGGVQPYNPADYNLYTIFDMRKVAYRNINLETLQWVQSRGRTYFVTHQRRGKV